MHHWFNSILAALIISNIFVYRWYKLNYDVHNKKKYEYIGALVDSYWVLYIFWVITVLVTFSE